MGQGRSGACPGDRLAAPKTAEWHHASAKDALTAPDFLPQKEKARRAGHAPGIHLICSVIRPCDRASACMPDRQGPPATSAILPEVAP